MSARTRTARPATTSYRYVAGLAGLALIASCSSGEQAGDTGDNFRHFAFTNAEVVIPSDDTYPVNLIFVASSNDPIWSQASSLAIPSGPQFGPTEFSVAKTELQDQMALGNLSFNLPSFSESISFEEVEIGLQDGSSFNEAVGDWTVTRSEAQESDGGPAIRQTGDYVLSVDRCEEFSTDITSSEQSSVTGLTIEVATPGAKAGAPESLPATIAPGETVGISTTIDCDSSLAEFYIFTPRLSWSSPEGGGTATLPPVSVGITALGDETITSILLR